MKDVISWMNYTYGGLRQGVYIRFTDLDNGEAHTLYKELSNIITNHLRDVKYAAEGYYWLLKVDENIDTMKWNFLLTCDGESDSRHGQFVRALLKKKLATA